MRAITQPECVHPLNDRDQRRPWLAKLQFRQRIITISFVNMYIYLTKIRN